LSAGELVWTVHHAIFEINCAERLLGHLMALRRRNPAIDQGKLNVVQRSRPGKQVEGLKNKSHFLIANAGKFVVVHVRTHSCRFSQYSPLKVYRGSQSDSLVLTCLSRGSDDGDIFALVYFKRNTMKRVYLSGAHLIRLPEIAHRDEHRRDRVSRFVAHHAGRPVPPGEL
jgi:hypothetical protein